MGQNLPSTTVVLITQDPILAKEVHQALAKESGFALLKSLTHPDDLAKTIQPSQACIILIDYQLEDEEASLRIIDKIASRYLSAAVVPILPESEVYISNKVILAGARAILLHPFPKGNAVSTLHRVRELLYRNLSIPKDVTHSSNRSTQSRSYVVFSPKGGVGCTTVAINLAIALHQQLKEKVLLVDGKHILGHVALMLNLRTGNSITDLLSNAEKLDEALISQVVVEHVSGINILASPTSIERSQDIQPENLYKVLQALKAIYPVIIVDGGSHLDDNLVTYMDMADGILLVINPNLASLRDARQFLNFSRTLSYSAEKIFLILNQSGHKADVKLNDIEKVLHTKILGMIPADEDMMLSCLNDGVPILLKKSNHPIGKAFKALSTAMVNTLATLAPGAINKNNPASDVLRKSSYLG